jgi:hypothetical protein
LCASLTPLHLFTLFACILMSIRIPKDTEVLFGPNVDPDPSHR